jgi:hypothetical protein
MVRAAESGVLCNAGQGGLNSLLSVHGDRQNWFQRLGSMPCLPGMGQVSSWRLQMKDLPPLSSQALKANVDHVEALLGSIREGRQVLELGKNERIYSQGDEGAAVYFIENGKVRISVVSAAGKEATLVILGPRNFFGEGCMVGHTVRIGTAETLEPSTLVRVEKPAR